MEQAGWAMRKHYEPEFRLSPLYLDLMEYYSLDHCRNRLLQISINETISQDFLFYEIIIIIIIIIIFIC